MLATFILNCRRAVRRFALLKTNEVSRFEWPKVPIVMAQSIHMFSKTLLARTLISGAAVGLCFSCGVKKEVLESETGGARNISVTGGAGNWLATGGVGVTVATGGAANSATACPSASGHVTALPTGACSGDGVCTLVVDAQCGPGVTSIPSSPPIFDCVCTVGSWSCHVRVAAGLGSTCEDAGAGGAGNATGGASASGGASATVGTASIGGTTSTSTDRIAQLTASCTASGGEVVSAQCCILTDDFPAGCNTTGPCSCGPGHTKDTRLCNCATGCFDGTRCVGQ